MECVDWIKVIKYMKIEYKYFIEIGKRKIKWEEVISFLGVTDEFNLAGKIFPSKEKALILIFVRIKFFKIEF